MNPLLKMKAIGDITLGTAEISLGMFTGAKIAAQVSTKGFWGKVISAFSGNATQGFAAALDAISPFIYFILMMLFAIGFSLSIYLPMVPFIFGYPPLLTGL